MNSPFDVWAPMYRAPFSGDVTQEISPSVLSTNIKGVHEIEKKIQTEVASYGKQLGKILEALAILSDKTDIPLPEISKLICDVDDVKKDCRDDVLADAENALKRLRKVDEDAWKRLTGTDG